MATTDKMRLPSRDELDVAVGRGLFTAADLAQALAISPTVARARLRGLVDEGTVVRTDETISGPGPGRPSKLYRLS